MKRFIFLVLVVVFSISVSSCDMILDKLWGHAYCDSYILSYYMMYDKDSELSHTSVVNGKDTLTMSIVHIGEAAPFCSAQSLRGEHAGSLVGGTTVTNPEAYDSLRIKYNDLFLPEKVKITNYVFCNSPGAIADEVTGIEITCDTDWNESYPAGSSLNELFSIEYFSYYSYIHNDYDKRFLKEEKKSVSLLKETDLRLLKYDSDLIFKTTILPVFSSATISITLKCKYGKEKYYLFIL